MSRRPLLLMSTKVAPCVPDARRPADPRLLRHVLEPVAAEVAEEPAALGLADHEDVRKAVPVVVADRHPVPTEEVSNSW
jgi:hypothetical protein